VTKKPAKAIVLYHCLGQGCVATRGCGHVNPHKYEKTCSVGCHGNKCKKVKEQWLIDWWLKHRLSKKEIKDDGLWAEWHKGNKKRTKKS